MNVQDTIRDISNLISDLADRADDAKAIILMLTHAPLPFWIKDYSDPDRAGRLVWANDYFFNEYKFEKCTALGKTDHDLWPAEYADDYRKTDLVVLEKKSLHAIAPIPDPILPVNRVYKWVVNTGGRTYVAGVAIPGRVVDE